MNDEILNATVFVSKNMRNIISTYVAGTMLTNCSDKKVRYKMGFYSLHTVLLVNILLLIIAINCYHYAKHKTKLKNMLPW